MAQLLPAPQHCQLRLTTAIRSWVPLPPSRQGLPSPPTHFTQCRRWLELQKLICCQQTRQSHSHLVPSSLSNLVQLLARPLFSNLLLQVLHALLLLGRSLLPLPHLLQVLDPPGVPCLRRTQVYNSRFVRHCGALAAGPGRACTPASLTACGHTGSVARGTSAGDERL